MKFNKKLLMAGTILGLSVGVSAPTFAQTNQTDVPAGAVKVDTQTDVTTDKVFNDSGEIVATKVEKTTTDTYKFDSNNNGIMDEDEYVTYSYTMIDINGDGYVDAVEWNNYTNIWYTPVKVEQTPDAQAFISYDLDGDGRIDMTEYQKAYDVKIYKAWDANQDGQVDMAEYDAVTSTYHTYDNEGVYNWTHLND